jgi:hypothetical protein
MSSACCKTSHVFWLLGGGGLLAAAGVLAVLLPGCFKTPPPTGTEGEIVTPNSADVPVPRVRFTDVTEVAGIRFRHFNGMTPNKLLPETMGSGVVVIDFDNDGKPDLLFLNSCPWPGKAKPDDPKPTPALYRNKGDGTFEDVTKAAGLDVTFFGMGGTVGDCDNDGWPDLFLTGIGGNHLFHNEADPGGANGRRFREVTATARVGGPGGWPGPGFKGDFFAFKDPLCFSSSAAFLDYDGDGKLDLFVCNYVTWSPDLNEKLGVKVNGIDRAFAQPTLFQGSQCFLYRNKGNKGDDTFEFEDVSREAGIEVFQQQGVGPNAPLQPVGKSLAVIVCDANGDGWPDIVVANDTVRNFFFLNVEQDGKRAFKEIGAEIGVAFAQGKARGAMGIDWAPLYRKDCHALPIANFAGEPVTFLCLKEPSREQRAAQAREEIPRWLHFSDMAIAEKVAGDSRNPLKFGLFFFDYDLDGHPDFLICNGHLDPEIGAIQKGQDYRQSAQLYWNTGSRSTGFQLVREEAAGPDLFVKLVGRGCAYLDYNGDGTPDVVLTGNGGPAYLLRNDNKLGHHWVRLKLEGDGKTSNRSAIGAAVTLEAGGLVQRREVAAARGYLSQSEMVLTFGLGNTTKVDRVTIRWPGRNAGEQVIEGDKIQLDQEQVIHQGK